MITIKKKRRFKNLKLYIASAILAFSTVSIVDNYINPISAYEETITNTKNIDNENEYIIQGICKVNNEYLVSAYNQDKTSNSVIYILDDNLNLKYKKELDTNSHVGGITYDKKNELIWITDNNATITGYNKEEILNNNSRLPVPKYKELKLNEDLENCFGTNSIAYITIYNNKLYVGNYNKNNNSILREYKIFENGYINKYNVKEYILPSYIQGITFYNKDNKTYLITSSSQGRYINSKLKIFEFNEDIDNYRGKEINSLKTYKMMEEIIVNEDELISVYESNAEIYKTLLNTKTYDIITSNINEIISNNKVKRKGLVE